MVFVSRLQWDRFLIALLWPLFQQEANLQRVKKGDAKASIHRMEIDRIRFVLSSYLRSRLQKVSQVEQYSVQNKALVSLSACWLNCMI